MKPSPVNALLQSLTWFGATVPLAVGIAEASGLSAHAGLWASLAGAVVTAARGGGARFVPGPTAALAVFLLGFTQRFDVASACLATVVAGGLQLTGAALGIAEGALAFFPSVWRAALAGLGLRLALAQTHVLFGAAPVPSTVESLALLPDRLHTFHPAALICGLLTLFSLVLWNTFFAKSLRFIPGALVAVGLGTAMSRLLPGHDLIPRVPPAGLLTWSAPSPGATPLGDVFLAGMVLALVASAQSLLVAGERPAPRLDAELLTHGVSNLVSGLLGGGPLSNAPEQAPVSRRVALLLSGWLALFAVFCAPVLAWVPRACLGALVLYVGLSLLQLESLPKLRGVGERCVYALTLLGVVFGSTPWGLGLGLTLAVGLLLRQAATLEVQTEDAGHVLKVTVTGSLHALSVPALTWRLRAVPPGREVELTLRVTTLEPAARDAVRAWRESYQRAGGRVR